MSEDEYYKFFEDQHLKLTGERTNLTEEWVRYGTDYFMFPDPKQLSARDRKAAVERAKPYFGIGIRQGGVH